MWGEPTIDARIKCTYIEGSHHTGQPWDSNTATIGATRVLSKRAYDTKMWPRDGVSLATPESVRRSS